MILSNISSTFLIEIDDPEVGIAHSQGELYNCSTYVWINK